MCYILLFMYYCLTECNEYFLKNEEEGVKQGIYPFSM